MSLIFRINTSHILNYCRFIHFHPVLSLFYKCSITYELSLLQKCYFRMQKQGTGSFTTLISIIEGSLHTFICLFNGVLGKKKKKRGNKQTETFHVQPLVWCPGIPIVQLKAFTLRKTERHVKGQTELQYQQSPHPAVFTLCSF